MNPKQLAGRVCLNYIIKAFLDERDSICIPRLRIRFLFSTALSALIFGFLICASGFTALATGITVLSGFGSTALFGTALASFLRIQFIRVTCYKKQKQKQYKQN